MFDRHQGGSATNDGGFGMARALGWKFVWIARENRSRRGRACTCWPTMHRCPNERTNGMRNAGGSGRAKTRCWARKVAREYTDRKKGLTPDDFPFAERGALRPGKGSDESDFTESSATAGGGLRKSPARARREGWVLVCAFLRAQDCNRGLSCLPRQPNSGNICERPIWSSPAKGRLTSQH